MMKRLKMLGMGSILLSVIFAGSGCLFSKNDDPVAPVTTDTTNITYSNATLTGPWISELGSQLGAQKLYLVFNGNGGVSEAAFYPANPPGNYQVNSNGSFTVTLKYSVKPGGEIDPDDVFTGTLTSATAGTSSGGSFKKVLNIAGCQGTWVGTLAETASDTTLHTYPISFTIDSNGVVTSFSGFTQPVSGKMFTESGDIAGFFRTGEPYASYLYDQISIWGTLSGNSITGSYSPNHLIEGIVTLIRQ